jgi:hypothetical protein
MQSVALDYHTIHQLTHTAVTRPAYYWTARLRYLLLTVFSFKSLSVQNPSYLLPTVLECTLILKLITYGYEPPVTDVSKPNKQTYQKRSATVCIRNYPVYQPTLHKMRSTLLPNKNITKQATAMTISIPVFGSCRFRISVSTQAYLRVFRGLVQTLIQKR